MEPGPAASVRPCALRAGRGTVVAGRSVAVPGLAAAYQPRVLREIRGSPPALIGAGCAVIGAADLVHLLCYTVWENQVHPSPAIHTLDEAYRRMQTGPSLNVGYIRVRVDRRSGAMRAVRLGTSAGGELSASVVRHVLSTLRFDSTRARMVRSLVAGGRPRVRRRVPLAVEGSRPAFATQAWNHLGRIAEEQEPAPCPVEAPLRPVSLSEYRRLHLAGRGQGDDNGDHRHPSPRRTGPRARRGSTTGGLP